MQVTPVTSRLPRQWALRAGAQTPTPEMERFQQLPVEAVTFDLTALRSDPLTTSAPSPLDAQPRPLFIGPQAAPATNGPVHNSSGSLCSVRSHRKSFRRKLADFFRRKRRKSNALDEEDDFEDYGSHPPRRISAPVLCHVSSATAPTPVLQALPVVFVETPPSVAAACKGPVLPFVGYRSNYLLAESLASRPRALVRPQRQSSPGEVCRLPSKADEQRSSLVGSLPDEEMSSKEPAKEEQPAMWHPCDESYEQQLSSSAYVFSLKRRRQVPRTNASTIYSVRPEMTYDLHRSSQRPPIPSFTIPEPPRSPPPPDVPIQPSPFFADKCVSVNSPDLSPLVTPTASDDEQEVNSTPSPLPPLPPSARGAVLNALVPQGKKGENPMVGEVANIVEEVNRMTEELLSALLHGSRLEN